MWQEIVGGEITALLDAMDKEMEVQSEELRHTEGELITLKEASGYVNRG